MLLGVAVTGNGLLDEPWRVFADLKRRSFCCQQRNASDLAQLQRNFWVGGVERFFNRASVGSEFSDYVIKAAADFQQPRSESGCRR